MRISLDSLMKNSAPAYPAEVAQPFRDELTALNFKELLTPADVDEADQGREDQRRRAAVRPEFISSVRLPA